MTGRYLLDGKPSARQVTAADDDHDGVFVCQPARQGPSRQVDPTLVVVETRFDPETGYFGFAWLTEDGERGIGTARGLNLHDSLVHAMCRAAHELLGRGRPNVRLVCWNRDAVGLMGQVLNRASVPGLPAFPLSERTKALLAQVIGLRHRVSVYADTCKWLHQGAADAEHLAADALRVQCGLETSTQVSNEPDGILKGSSASEEPRLIGPDEKIDRTWWLMGQPDGGHLAWQTALHRMHLDGGWCVLPEGELSAIRGRHQRLQLRLEHRDGGRPHPAPTQEVTLRRRGGRWELNGIHWPDGLLPGVLVTFKWPPNTRLVTASTALLPAPERFDDIEFRHRYDPQVVTRENAPGFDQNREVPDLSDVSWILRTLRTLGYLSADGSATLAEEALVRNCLRLGMPRSRVDRITRAVEQLLHSGQIERVSGSLDQHGRPWHPRRTGQLPADLLRYVPHVEAIDSSIRREDPDVEWVSRRSHSVTGFVRRLPSGKKASEEQVGLHRDAVLNAEVVDCQRQIRTDPSWTVWD